MENKMAARAKQKDGCSKFSWNDSRGTSVCLDVTKNNSIREFNKETPT
jgi:hypothetical protein